MPASLFLELIAHRSVEISLTEVNIAPRRTHLRNWDGPLISKVIRQSPPEVSGTDLQSKRQLKTLALCYMARAG